MVTESYQNGNIFSIPPARLICHRMPHEMENDPLDWGGNDGGNRLRAKAGGIPNTAARRGFGDGGDFGAGQRDH